MAWEGVVLHAAQPRASRCQSGGGARLARDRAARRALTSLCRCLCGRARDRGGGRVPSPGLEMTPQRPGTLIPLLLVALLTTAAVGIQIVRDRGWQPYQPPVRVMWIRSGPLAQRLALSFRSLAADVYWM